MEIQNSLFQANRGVGHAQKDQSHATGTAGDAGEVTARVQQEKLSGSHSMDVIDRLTQKLKVQSENPDKVAALKEKIASGSFEIDPAKIAEKLLWGEQVAAMAAR